MFRRRPYRQCAVTRLNELSFSDLRQRPRLAYRSHGPGTREATIHLVDNALPNHQPRTQTTLRADAGLPNSQP
jgi:hypothetical protein